MGKDASVAPKERVNIVYRPATGDAKEDVELPLKLLVMGDFTMQDDDTPVEDRKAMSIDKNNFNEVLKSNKLKLDVNVKDELSEGEEEGQIAMNLKFDSIKDFDPDAIVAQVPELKKLIEVREALKALKGPLGNVPDFRKKVQDLIQDEGTRQQLMKELQIGSED